MTYIPGGGGGGTTTNALTINNGGAGAASGATFNGSAAVTISYNTVGAQASDATLTSLAAYNTNGLVAQTAADTFAGRTLTAPAAGITISNPAGIAGNPTFALANDLSALEALSGTNTIYYRSAADTWSAVTVGTGLSFSAGTLSASGGYGYERSPTVPTSGGYTLQQVAGGTATMGSVTEGLTLTQPTGTDRFAMIKKNGSLPSVPFTFLIRAVPLVGRHGARIDCGIIVRNSANANAVIFGDWDQESYFASRFGDYNANAGNALLQGGSQWFKNMPWRYVTVSATECIFGASPDGFNLVPLWTETIATHLSAVDEVGFGSTQLASGVTGKALFQSAAFI